MDDYDKDIFDDSEHHQASIQTNNEENQNQKFQDDREPDYPSELNQSENQLDTSEYEQTSQLIKRPPKDKKPKKTKSNKNNISITNRSSSAKWRMVDPYLQGDNTKPKGVKNSKKVDRKNTDTKCRLPPIKKQNSTNPNKNANSRAYKPLHQQKLNKNNSVMSKDIASHKQLPLDDDFDNSKRQKASKAPDVDYEKKNLERLQKIQEKKAQELAMIEDQRQKAHEKREKLKEIVTKSPSFIGLQTGRGTPQTSTGEAGERGSASEARGTRSQS